MKALTKVQTKGPTKEPTKGPTLGRLDRAASARPMRVLALLALGALALTLLRIDQMDPMGRIAPFALWRDAILHRDADDIRWLVIEASFLPRVAISVLCGALLALSGVLFQQILRNPIAEPATLGVSAGASLAMTLVLALAPAWLAVGQTAIAAAGAGIALLLAMGLAWRQRLSPTALVLGGLIISFYSGAIGSVLTLFHHNAMQAIFIWGAGSMNQGSWHGARVLTGYLSMGLALTFALARPLELMSLGDATARGLGLPPAGIRTVGLALAVLLSAAVVSTVGVVGFVGLVAPAIVRLLGVHTFRARATWATVFGAVLVWLTDQTVQSLGGALARLPTGAVIALLASPVLLWLLPRFRSWSVVHEAGERDRDRVRAPLGERTVYVAFAVLGVALAALIVISLMLGRDLDGWHWLSRNEFDVLVDYRLARMLAAVAGGAMLAMAGVIVQRLTGNPMASPEVLGISSGASLGVFALALCAPAAGAVSQSVAACVGACGAFAVLLALARRSAFAPSQMILAGVAIGTAFSALATIVLLSGTPRAAQLLAWMAGSTYRVGAGDAAFAVGALALAVAAAPLLYGWLQILPLGESVARGRGVDPRASRLMLLIVASLLTASGTQVVGPLSFVGLMAPHAARMLGFVNVRSQMPAATLIGALILCAADWLGRNIAFPFQVPAGLLATLLGGLYFMGLMMRGNGRA
ncbi:Fe(3+)-hydroxamate ABC transporter permease FhuB [Pararobbsia silviterrae]|nr:Fe(3+)-hydroxamate ABC transporter permease FhuB [Pararobbsia silviterrae]